ncbi:MAG: TatD DNase family protein [Bradymonadia bacterium]|jgi:TatD DNase family protein
MEWIDIGVNLTNKRFRNDLDAVIARARAAGVVQQIVTGTSVDASVKAAELAQNHDLHSTAGVHPHDAKSLDSKGLQTIADLASRPVVVAIGECGLDYDRDFSPRPKQREAFAEQLDLAVQLGLPVFLHERAAHADFLEILRPRMSKLRAAIVHCFTTDAPTLAAYLDLGAYIGITGWICDERRGGDLRACVNDIPLDRVLIETDAPYLTPRDLRPKPKGGRNEPAFLPHVGAEVARRMGVDVAQLAAVSTANARTVFGL